MNDFGTAFSTAFALIGRFDADLREIVILSLEVSLTASACAFAIGAPLGTALAVYHFRGRAALVVIVNAFSACRLLSLVWSSICSCHARPLRLARYPVHAGCNDHRTVHAWDAIVIALVHRVAVGDWRAYGDALLVDGASRLRTVGPLLSIGREGLLTAFLAAFGRANAEVGAIIIVGGNINGYTRTMTTTIALETSKGNLSFALALGIILIILSMMVSSMGLFIGRGLTER